MTRAWTEAVANLSDLVPIPLLAFLSVLAATLVALGWYFWPAWLPWNWRSRSSSATGRRTRARPDRQRRRLGSLRWRWRLRWRRRKSQRPPAGTPAELPADQLPDLPAALLALTADQLAEAGRYAEAVRERLRAIVRSLIERGLIPYSPGWTVTELAAAAGHTRPALSPPLRAATGVFSEIWYGLRAAHAADDAAMRTYASQVAQLLDEPMAVGAP